MARSPGGAAKYNLFSFAPRELSHSAFWAWILQCADAPAGLGLEGPRAIAAELLHRIGVPAFPLQLEVWTEKRLSKLGRADVWARLDGRDEVVIETKVTATPDPEQLARYRLHRAAEGGTVALAIITTAFDGDVREALLASEGWTVLDLERLQELVRPARDTHPLVRDYAEWLDARAEERRRWRNDAVHGSPDEMKKALGTAEGQWHLMRYLTEDLAGRPYRGVNLDGTPWTQFGFCEDDGAHDALFYRIGSRKEGPYFSLRQYQKNPTPSGEAKRSRLAWLQELWLEAWARSGAGVRPRFTGSRGTMESEVGWFLLTETPPTEIRRVLPTVHAAFVAALSRHGWPVARGGPESPGEDAGTLGTPAHGD